MKSILITAVFISLSISGCSQQDSKSVTEPTAGDIQIALDRAVATLNNRTNSTIKRITFSQTEIHKSCFEHLDYYAQQLLWAEIFYPNSGKVNIDCNLAPSNKQ